MQLPGLRGPPERTRGLQQKAQVQVALPEFKQTIGPVPHVPTEGTERGAAVVETTIEAAVEGTADSYPSAS